ncbi:MAG: glycosyltransferase family 4 protein [Vicinamibacteraceae bacterium]
MQILAITAGAGAMYCGSCLRDNALAAELLARGHDVVLLPVYTPTRTDEPNVSRQEVLLGGISVYLEEKIPLFRYTPKLLDRLWDAPRVIRAVTRRAVSTDPATLGEMTVSMLRGEHGPHRKEIVKLLDWLRDQPAPDLTTLPNSLLIALAEPIARATRRPVGVTLQGEDLFLDGLREPYRAQALDLIRRQVDFVHAFFAVSERYAPRMSARLAIPPEKMHVIPLGINADDFQRGPQAASRPGVERRVERSSARREDVVRIGFLARIAPEKGLHVLCEAYQRLRARSDGLPAMRLEAAGYLAPEQRGYLADIERRMREAGLSTEFRYVGELDRPGKVEFLRDLDVFSMPATYDEPKALSVLEAMASGVPVVLPRRGALPEIIEKTDGGLLVDPDDVDALAEGLHAVLADPALAERLGTAGYAGVREHYTTSRMADRALEAYGAVIARDESKSPIPRGRAAR